MNHQELLRYAADRLDDLAADDDEGTGLLALCLRHEADIERWTAEEVIEAAANSRASWGNVCEEMLAENLVRHEAS